MKKSRLALYISTGAVFALFIAFTILVKFVDVQATGLYDSVIGFATMNKSIHEYLGRSDTWYKVSEILGLLAIAIAGAFVVIGIIQWIKRKKLSLVDKEIWFLALIYALTIGFYLLFELVIINYRPVLIENELEASFPSSHTMLACVILGTAIFSTHLFTKNKVLKIVCITLFSLLMFVIVVGRLASGVHWFTDIIGGILLSASLVMLYISLIKTFAKKRETNENLQ